MLSPASPGFARQFSSKFVATYEKLFQNYSLEQPRSQGFTARFWADLFALDVNREYLSQKLNEMPKEYCLGQYKPALNALFAASVAELRAGRHDEPRKTTAVDTLQILFRCILSKNLAGWEVMEIFAGGVGGSDKAFTELTESIDMLLRDGNAAVALRHSVLQLAIIFMCGINQLSPGAYFLQRNFFPAISSLITSPETEQFTFEAVLFLAILANFHKSDAAKLNPYLQQLKETNDLPMLRKVCWVASFAAVAATKAYQKISDDSPPTLMATIGSFVTSLRPDRALSSTPVDPPRELFKNQPIEASIILLPVFEFTHANPIFLSVLSESLVPIVEGSSSSTRPSTPLPIAVISLSSYLLTHACSVSSPRAMAYANLALTTLLAWTGSGALMRTFCEPTSVEIRLCRQRLPALPTAPLPRPPVCALLDCCVLWLRHNLQKRLEVSSYTICISSCYSVVYYLHQARVRLDYHWIEIWRAIIGLLDFLSGKLNDLHSTGGVELLVQETIRLLHFVLSTGDAILPSPRAVHEFIYELVRSSGVLKKQETVLKALAQPGGPSHRRASSLSMFNPKTLTNLISVTQHYEDLIGKTGAHSAQAAMKIVGKAVEQDGVYGVQDVHSEDDPPKIGEDVIGFIRFACNDGMGLMP